MSPEARTRIESQDEDVRVSSLELFFDLVFVFTITQLTATLAHHPTSESLLQVVLMLVVIWWMYSGYARLTNAIPPERTVRRLFLLGEMACFLVISLAIPTTFSGDGVVFAVACLGVPLRVWARHAVGRPSRPMPPAGSWARCSSASSTLRSISLKTRSCSLIGK